MKYLEKVYNNKSTKKCKHRCYNAYYLLRVTRDIGGQKLKLQMYFIFVKYLRIPHCYFGDPTTFHSMQISPRYILSWQKISSASQISCLVLPYSTRIYLHKQMQFLHLFLYRKSRCCLEFHKI